MYADLDDGPFHLMEPQTWRSPSGAPYDYQEEVKVGVTVEHAAYYLSWLTAFFGPAKTVTAFSSCLWPERRVDQYETLNLTTPTSRWRASPWNPALWPSCHAVLWRHITMF